MHLQIFQVSFLKNKIINIHLPDNHKKMDNKIRLFFYNLIFIMEESLEK